MTDAPATGTHHFVPDLRNESVLIDVNGAHFPRAEARVSVFDSGFMLGDGVWEGVRVHRGRIAFLGRHLDRLYRGAKAIAQSLGNKDAHPHAMDPRNIPGCTYCHPQVASVGLTEAKAKEAGHEVRVGKFPAIGNGKAIALGEVEGFIKTVFDAKTANCSAHT